MPGTLVYDKILPWFPGGAGWFLWISNGIAIPVLGIHLFEAYKLDNTRLRKYGIERGSHVWWKWIMSCLLEGYPCFQRIDGEVKRKEVEAAKLKH